MVPSQEEVAIISSSSKNKTLETCEVCPVRAIWNLLVFLSQTEKVLVSMASGAKTKYCEEMVIDEITL